MFKKRVAVAVLGNLDKVSEVTKLKGGKPKMQEEKQNLKLPYFGYTKILQIICDES